MSTIPLKQQVRDLSQKLEKSLHELKLADAKLRQSEISYQQLQRSVNAFHIRLEALKMATGYAVLDDIKIFATQFEKWLIEGFEPVVDKKEEE
jgi:hypothetical protein